MKDSITVHAFTHVDRHQVVSRSYLDTDDDEAVLFSQGRATVHAVCEATGWQTPRTSVSQECFLKNAFTYLFPPPLISNVTTLGSTPMKEWNTRPSGSETFSIAELHPFENTLVFFPRTGLSVGIPAVLEDHNRHGSICPSQPLSKCMKVEVDMGPLDELIHLPHYIPAPFMSSQHALPRALLDTHYPLTPIPPQTTSSINALFSSTYSRVAWLIPVRGVPPWDGVSRASIAFGHLPVPWPVYLSSGDITWTHDSLRQFWFFLISCSKSCSETHSSVTGPLSLSFHTTQAVLARSQRGIASPTASGYIPANRETGMTPPDPSPAPSAASASGTRLKDIDYIKWAYEGKGNELSEDSRTRRKGFRVLEFAKLALVNERGEGILVS
ncbi:hypothetical protein B0F90DRAFT_1728484 [Multifurca ochricompacta]|uniref:Uncharacterized protein n=1 Tax=Multifurca ochricompacta TaxID=376703 RepID=A0AAD4QMV3_9AGAM|nr:hypothetical protein B0F90DRAFT_1728484 [Multifurca ochricompacta]